MAKLLSDGMLIQRPHADPIQDVCIFGERSTGTNLLNIVLKAAFGFHQAKDYGWKHGPPTFLAARPSTLFVVSLRDAIAWSVSLYARPRYADPSVLDLTYREFIQTPWRSMIQNTPKANHPVGAALQLDRHPISGQLYPDIFQMRQTKYQSWLGLAQRDVNLVVLRHETFMDQRENCLNRIADAFDLSVAPDSLKEPEYLFKRRRGEEQRRLVALNAIETCADVFSQRIDHPFERSLGYH